MTYFGSCTSLLELKKRYRELAMRHHPDHGGDVEVMKVINAEYSEAVKQFSRYGNVPKEDRRAYAGARAYYNDGMNVRQRTRSVIEWALKNAKVLSEAEWDAKYGSAKWEGFRAKK